jgi:vitamin K-dependent gamma-carboxylase
MVHLGGFILDLTVGFWLLWPKSRPLALFFATSFHMMNAQLFTIGIYSSLLFTTLRWKGGKKTIPLNLIYHQPKTTFFFLKGMFPYVCLATLPVFCDDDWPKRWIAGCPGLLRKCLPDATKITNVSPVEKRGKNSSFKLTLMGLYVVTQLALPWSHSVTQVC